MYIYVHTHTHTHFPSGCPGDCNQHLNLQQSRTYQCQLNFNFSHTEKLFSLIIASFLELLLQWLFFLSCFSLCGSKEYKHTFKNPLACEVVFVGALCVFIQRSAARPHSFQLWTSLHTSCSAHLSTMNLFFHYPRLA